MRWELEDAGEKIAALRRCGMCMARALLQDKWRKGPGQVLGVKFFFYHYPGIMRRHEIPPYSPRQRFQVLCPWVDRC